MYMSILNDRNLKELCEFIEDYINKLTHVKPKHGEKYSRFGIDGIKNRNFFAFHFYKQFIRMDVTMGVSDKKNLFYRNQGEGKTFRSVHVVSDASVKIRTTNAYPGSGKIILTIDNGKIGKERYTFKRDTGDDISIDYILDIIEKNYKELHDKY